MSTYEIHFMWTFFVVVAVVLNGCLIFFVVVVVMFFLEIFTRVLVLFAKYLSFSCRYFLLLLWLYICIFYSTLHVFFTYNKEMRIFLFCFISFFFIFRKALGIVLLTLNMFFVFLIFNWFFIN